MESRLELLESGPSTVTEDMQSLNDRLAFLDMRMEEKHFTGTLAWCENISVQKNRKVIRKDCRENSLFTGNDSNLLIVFYVQIMPDDFVMQLHRF